MVKIFSVIIMCLVITSVSCVNANKKTKEPIVAITTDYGVIKLKLYDETPEHKNNFIKLINEGFYNDLLFHRVISNFMIQGGDPDSRNAEPGKRLGSGSPGYTLPAEIIPGHFHHKGVLAAARRGGPSNPEKRSSGSQFYIVQGKIFSEGALDTLEMSLNNKAKNELLKKKFGEATDRLDQFRTNNDQAGFNIAVAEIRAEADSIFESEMQFSFTEEQRNVYTTLGGYPSLDREYTIFGEVIEGLDVLDKIAAVETDRANRPLTDIKMQITLE